MAGSGTRHDQSESQLCALLIRKRVLTEGQLKAALDYQRSLGGDLAEILVRLNLVRSQQLDALHSGEVGGDSGDGSDGSTISPSMLKVDELTVHRKLLEKIPHELVRRFLLVTFFPAGKVSQRRIILGHGMELPSDMTEKVGSLLGVQLCSLALESSAAGSLLQAHGFLPSDWTPVEAEEPRSSGSARGGLENSDDGAGASAGGASDDQASAPARESERRSNPESQASGDRLDHVFQRPAAGDGQERGTKGCRSEASPPSSADSSAVLMALVSVLSKKGLITREEIEVEIELSRIRQKADSLTPA